MFSYAPVGLRLQPVPIVSRFGALGQAGLPPTLPPPVPREAFFQPVKSVAEGIAGIARTGMAVGAGMVVLSAGAVWVGIHTGIKEKGFLSFTGWTVGVLAGMGGVLTLATIAGLGAIKNAANAAAGQ